MVGSQAISLRGVCVCVCGGEVAAVVSNTGTPDTALATPMVTDHTKAESHVAGDQLQNPAERIEDLASSLMVDLSPTKSPCQIY